MRIYTGEWFRNIGLVGFIRILEKNNIQIKKEDNYIEFNINDLQNFSKYYFNYLIEEYKFKDRYENRINRYMEIMKNKDKFKDYLKQYKKIIDDCTKKLTNTIYSEKINEIKDEFKEIKQFDDYKRINVLSDKLIKLLDNKDIEIKFALKFIHSVLYDNFFGQVSFLQKSMVNKSLDEHIKTMDKDYVFPVIFEENLSNMLKNNENYEGIKNYIESQNDIFKKSNKYGYFDKILKLEKKKGKDFVIEKLRCNENPVCSLCEEMKSIDEDFTEGVFVPLGMSNTNSYNMFWKFNTKYPICDMCRLILLCAPAGIETVNKYYLKENNYYYSFVNLDTDVDTLCKTNNNFKNKLDTDSPLEALLIDIVKELKDESIWAMQNILYVEFNAKYESRGCNLHYFNIPKYEAIFFKNFAEKTISKIKDRSFKNEILDYILRNQDLNKSINNKIHDCIVGSRSGYDCYFGIKAKHLINECKVKKEVSDIMSYKVYDAFRNGQELRIYYVSKKAENKINGIAYRLLNSVKVGNKKDFMDSLLRIYMNAEKSMPNVFLNVFTEKDIDFESIGQSFIAGLISDKIEEKKEENANE